MSRLVKLSVPVIAVAALYQFFIADMLVMFGVWRVIQPLSDFPGYSCRRIRHTNFQGCEDMWVDDEARLLYAACSGTIARQHWAPTVGHLNTTMRPVGGNWISVLSIDEPGADGLFAQRKARIHGYKGATASDLDLNGFDVEILPDGTRRFWLVNRRPPVDADGNLIDATKTGDNSTLDVFDTVKGGEDLQFVKTILSPNVVSPNKPAAVGDGSVLVTNDVSFKVGIRKQVELILGGGSVAYCSPSNECHLAASSGFKMPNGMVRGKDGLFWVPNSMMDKVMAMSLDPKTKMLSLVASVSCEGMGVDNLSVDKNGDILAAALPSPLQFLAHAEFPFHKTAAASIFRIRKVGEPYEYKVEKIIEDRDSVALSGVTVAVHDVKSGRIFTGGAIAPYISVCETVNSQA